MVHIIVALCLNIYVPISLCAFKTKLERQNKMEYHVTDLGVCISHCHSGYHNSI